MTGKILFNNLCIFIIVAAIAIRLLLMPISMHSDFLFINMFPTLLTENGLWDISRYLNENTPNNGFSYYPPLTYYSLSIFQLTYKFISNSFYPWMDSLRNAYVSGLKGQAVDYILSSPNKYIYRDIFLAKLPYLVFDVGAVVIIFIFIKKKLIPKKSIFVWLLNPVLIYTTYIFGQFDIIPLFFVLLGFLVLKKRKYLGVFILGIAGAYKVYPYIIAFPTALIYGDNLKEKIKLTILAFSPFVFFVIPTLISSPVDAFYYFFPKNMFHYKNTLEGWQKISTFVKYGSLALSYFIVIFASFVLKLKDKWRLSLSIGFLSILIALTLAGRSHFHYLFWEAPFLVLWFKDSKQAYYILLIQTISFASYKLLANQLQLGLFSPVNPSYFSNLPTFNSLISIYIPYRVVSTLGFFIFTTTNIYIIFMILKELIFTEETLSKRISINLVK